MFLFIGVLVGNLIILLWLLLIFSLEKLYSMLNEGLLCNFVFLILKLSGNMVFI